MAKIVLRYFLSICFLAVLLINHAWGFSNNIKSINPTEKESYSQSQILSHQALHLVFGLEEDRQPFAELNPSEKEGEFEEKVKIGNDTIFDIQKWSQLFQEGNIWMKTSGFSGTFRLSNHQFTTAKKFIFFRVFRIWLEEIQASDLKPCLLLCLFYLFRSVWCSLNKHPDSHHLSINSFKTFL